MSIRWPLVVRRTHKWLALFVGVQAVLWTVTGFYMVAVHIDYIHGDYLIRKAQERPFNLSRIVSPDRVALAHPEAREIRLQRLLERPVWRIKSDDAVYLVDARSGRRLPGLTRAQVEEAARAVYAGDPTIVSAKLLSQAPMEIRSAKPPLWQIEFKGWNRPTFYISPTTGELVSRRHALWRVYDFAWMLHIMDYDARTDVNNPLLRVVTWSAAMMVLSGAWLLLWSFPRRKRKKT